MFVLTKTCPWPTCCCTSSSCAWHTASCDCMRRSCSSWLDMRSWSCSRSCFNSCTRAVDAQSQRTLGTANPPAPQAAHAPHVLRTLRQRRYRGPVNMQRQLQSFSLLRAEQHRLASPAAVRLASLQLPAAGATTQHQRKEGDSAHRSLCMALFTPPFP